MSRTFFPSFSGSLSSDFYAAIWGKIAASRGASLPPRLYGGPFLPILHRVYNLPGGDISDELRQGDGIARAGMRLVAIRTSSQLSVLHESLGVQYQQGYLRLAQSLPCDGQDEG